MIVYDDYNKRVKSDQTCIGTVMPNFKNSALRSGTKIIENENKVNFRVRKLTPKECWRLMGFNDEDYYAAKTNSMDVSREILAKYPHEGKRQMDEAERLSRMSNTQLYKQAGNSIVVDVLVHIMENLYDAMPYLFDDIEVGSFFSGIGAFEKALTRLGTDEGNHKSSDIPNAELNQIGYINNYNGDANRIYDSQTVARVLKAEAGGGGAKTGWSSVETSAPPERVIIDDTYGFRDEPTVYRDIL